MDNGDYGKYNAKLYSYGIKPGAIDIQTPRAGSTGMVSCGYTPFSCCGNGVSVLQESSSSSSSKDENTKDTIASSMLNSMQEEVNSLKNRIEDEKNFKKTQSRLNGITFFAILLLMIVLLFQAGLFAFVVYKFNIQICDFINWALGGISIFTVIELLGIGVTLKLIYDRMK